MSQQGATFHFIQRLQQRYGLSIDPATWQRISDEIRAGKHHYLVSSHNRTDWYYLKIGSRWVYAAFRRDAGLITTLTESQFRTTHGYPCQRTYQLPARQRKRSLLDLIDTMPVPEGWRVDAGYAYRLQSRSTTRH